MESICVESKDQREYRRLCAWNMHLQGYRQCEIARALGVTAGAVCQWIKKATEEGVEALKKAPHKGRTRRLSEEQLAELPRHLAQGAESYGFRGDVWTQERVAVVIERVFGVKYHPYHMYRILRIIGFSQQKPIRRATQRNEEAIQRWKDEEWPRLKKSAKKRNAP